MLPWDFFLELSVALQVHFSTRGGFILNLTCTKAHHADSFCIFMYLFFTHRVCKCSLVHCGGKTGSWRSPARRRWAGIQSGRIYWTGDVAGSWPSPAASVRLKKPWRTEPSKGRRRADKTQTAPLCTRSAGLLRPKPYEISLASAFCLLCVCVRAHVKSLSATRQRRVRLGAVCSEPPLSVRVSSAGMEADTASHTHDGVRSGRSLHYSALMKCVRGA